MTEPRLRAPHELLRSFLFRDVPRGRRRAHEPPGLVADRRNRDGGDEFVAVLPDPDRLERRDRLAGSQVVHHPVEFGPPIFRHEERNGPPDRFLRGVAEHLFRARVPADDSTLEGFRVDPVGRPFHDGPEARLRLADGPQLRDVDEARDDDPLIPEVDRLRGQERPPDLAQPRTDRHLLVADRAEFPEPFADVPAPLDVGPHPQIDRRVSEDIAAVKSKQPQELVVHLEELAVPEVRDDHGHRGRPERHVEGLFDVPAGTVGRPESGRRCLDRPCVWVRTDSPSSSEGQCGRLPFRRPAGPYRFAAVKGPRPRRLYIDLSSTVRMVRLRNRGHLSRGRCGESCVQ